MFKTLNFALIILMTNIIFSQSGEKVYVILDDNSFYKITKKENSATIEIPYHAYKEDWNKKDSKNTNDDIVKVDSSPNKKYYRFYSIKEPIIKLNINKINTFPVVDVSKESKEVWKKYPYEIIFIEKINCEEYIFWHMKPEFNE